jgi:hypothetical protein
MGVPLLFYGYPLAADVPWPIVNCPESDICLAGSQVAFLVRVIGKLTALCSPQSGQAATNFRPLASREKPKKW